jgi:hypothetical protein
MEGVKAKRRDREDENREIRIDRESVYEQKLCGTA